MLTGGNKYERVGPSQCPQVRRAEPGHRSSLIAFSFPVQPCRVVGGPICLVGEVLSQTCLDKKRTGLLMARQPANRRAHEQLKTNQGADGISRQAENQRSIPSAKENRLARLHLHL